MLRIAILFSLCCPFRSALRAQLTAPYALLSGGNDMGHGWPEGSRVLRGIRKAEGHVGQTGGLRDLHLSIGTRCRCVNGGNDQVYMPAQFGPLLLE